MGADEIGGELPQPVIRLLGPATVVGAAAVGVTGARQIGLLALLAEQCGRRVSTYRIEDELWGGRAVSDAAVRVTVNRLRSRLDAAGVRDVLVSETGGYRLDLDPDLVDMLRFECLVARTREAAAAGDHDAVLSGCAAALDLWRGEPFDGRLDAPGSHATSERLARAQVDVVACGAAALLDADRCQEAFDLLDRAVSASHREDVAGLRMIAAMGLRRRELAVDTYRRLCEALDRDVGIAPGHDLIELWRSIGGEDGGFERAARAFLPRGSVRADRGSLPPGDLPPDAHFVGRTAVLRELDAALRRGALVVVEAEPGMGKSSVARQLVARRRDATVLSLAGRRLDGGPGQLLHALCRGRAGPAADALADVLDAADRGNPGADLFRFCVHEAAQRQLQAISPTFVVVDDLQWIDEDAARLLSHLIDRCPAIPWLLLARPRGQSSGASDLLADLRSRWPDRSVAVALPPMTDDEVGELVRRRGAGDLDHEVVATVVSRSRGWPLLATELAHHLAVGGSGDDLPTSMQRAVTAMLAGLDDSARRAAQLVAVAGVALAASEVLRQVGGSPDTAVQLVGAGVARLDRGRLSITHDVVRDCIVAEIPSTDLRDLHLRAARAILAEAGPSAFCVHHLLAASPDGREELEAAVAPALRGLRRSAAFVEAAELGAAFIEADGPLASTTDGIASRIEVAASLLASGRVDEGLAVHDGIMAQVRRQRDPELLAAALLARGPVDVASPAGGATVTESLELLGRLPVTASAQRIQLMCWVAHHRLLVAGRGEQVDDLLDEAEHLAGAAGDEELAGMVLGIRYQATAAVSDTAAEGARMFEQLRRWAGLTGTTSTEAMVRLFALDRAAVDGSRSDHADAVAALAGMVERFPRPDVRWYVEAGRAANLLAGGDLDAAADQMVVAAELGRSLHVGAADAIERVQQMLMLSARGLLGAVAPMFDGPPDEDDLRLTAIIGRVALEVGDVDRARAAADVLSGRTDLLRSLGAGWPVIAHVAAELAAGCGHERLGSTLVDELRHRSGSGLTMLGLVVLGSTDRIIGLAHVGRGDLVAARRSLVSAAERDERLGFAFWAQSARRALDSDELVVRPEDSRTEV